MPRALKAYIATIVTLSALALLVATLLYPANPRIALSLTHASATTATPPSSFEIALGVMFWTIVTLVASALPVRLPQGTHQAVSMAPSLPQWYWVAQRSPAG